MDVRSVLGRKGRKREETEKELITYLEETFNPEGAEFILNWPDGIFCY